MVYKLYFNKWCLEEEIHFWVTSPSLWASMLMCLLGSLSLSDGPTTSVDTWSNSPKMQPGVGCKSVSGSIVSVAEKKKICTKLWFIQTIVGCLIANSPKNNTKIASFHSNFNEHLLLRLYNLTFHLWLWTLHDLHQTSYIIWLDRSHSLVSFWGWGPLEISMFIHRNHWDSIHFIPFPWFFPAQHVSEWLNCPGAASSWRNGPNDCCSAHNLCYLPF